MVVVYKYDRLSRSMLDFLQLLDRFKRNNVSFVSVSQRFDTSTPVGEVTLNILLSFAQFERQMIGERTRDKIHACRRRGRWTGGRPVLGYDVAPGGGKIVVNKDEAKQVVAIFELYAEMESTTALVAELNRRGWTQKRWRNKRGTVSGGTRWTKQAAHTVLSNPLYRGLQKLGDETFRGEHDAIVSKNLFDSVQHLLDANGNGGGSTQRNRHGALLRGLLRCAACDRAMGHTWSRKGGRLYRYYQCQTASKVGASACQTGSLPADRIERYVVDQLRRIGADPELQAATFDEAVRQVKAERRGLRAEQKRLERDRGQLRTEVEQLVSTLARTTGSAAQAVTSQVEAAQDRLGRVEARLDEITTALAGLRAEEIDRDAVAAALIEFDPIWEVLTVPERERVVRLVVDGISYDAASGELAIDWRLAGFGQLAAEVAT